MKVRTSINQAIQAAIKDPATSDLLRDALKAAMLGDPLDVTKEAGKFVRVG